jgi:subtilisin family serine protease
MKKIVFPFFALTCAIQMQAQNAPIQEQWQHGDAATDGLIGVSSAKALKEFSPASGQFAPVVVAIIDSGTETSHPDLKNNLWTNPGEIAGNGKDDDNNGYIDDIHGWSFIGGKNGDVEKDNLEFIRVYKMYSAMFPDGKCVKGKEKEFKMYNKLKSDYDARLAKAQADVEEYETFSQVYRSAKLYFMKNIGEDYTIEEVQNFKGEGDSLELFKQLVVVGISNNFDAVLPQWGDQVMSALKYGYSLDFDPRTVVGDNYADVTETKYGNNHIDGPAGEHGTHVGGIVGAARDGQGMDGICPSAKLMIIRCVPDGDERDKDVANAIFYAVNNGARVINMSFGKAYSPFKERVDEAVKYAESKGVLLIHAAGNDNKDVDVKDNFPCADYQKGGKCKTWIEVGASGSTEGQLKADFSNFGRKSVDVFAPGVNIYSTVPDHKYEAMSGTSMASPVTAGVAAAILSYYPELTGEQVKKLILESAVSYRNTHIANAEESVEGEKKSFLSPLLSRPAYFGLGYAFIDDDGEPLGNLLNVKDAWSFSSYPSAIQIGSVLNNRWKAGIAFNFSKYNANNKNGVVDATIGNIWSVEATSQYKFYQLPVCSSALSFSTIQGLGYTKRSLGEVMTTVSANTGLSLEYGICQDWSVQVSSQAKWSLNNYEKGGSYLQHGVSVIYTIPGKDTFAKYSRTGAVVNLYKALELAEKRFGK